MENQLIRYIRNEDNSPRGVAVAIRSGDNVDYGFSLHNPIDKWDKKLGIKKAIARANAGKYNLPEVPDRLDAVMNAYKHLSRRAEKYFKDVPKENLTIEVD